MDVICPGEFFFNLILASRKSPAASQNDCLKGLLYIYDRSVKGLTGNSLGTIASRFRNCDPDLNSDYFRFGDPVTVQAFENRMKDAYDDVVAEMKCFADKYLDVDTNGVFVTWIY